MSNNEQFEFVCVYFWCYCYYDILRYILNLNRRKFRYFKFVALGKFRYFKVVALNKYYKTRYFKRDSAYVDCDTTLINFCYVLKNSTLLLITLNIFFFFYNYNMQ